MNPTTDWFDVDEIEPDTYQITEARGVLPCNSFVVDGGDEALVIDTGLGIGDLRATVADLVDPVPRLLLTHTHWDHIGAAHQFDDAVVHDRERTADGSVTIDGLSDEFVDRPDQFVASWRDLDRTFPKGFDPDEYTILPATNVGAIEPGDTLTVGNRELELLAVPGHSPGQLGALDHEAGILFGGDVVGIGGDLYAHFEDCDIEAYIETFDDLLDHYNAGAFDVLATGHNRPYRDEEIEVLAEMRAGLADILNERGQYETIDTDWGPARRYDFDEFTVLTGTDVV
ncbi:MBL fold metallo-hydrolase [Natronosalvus halobius]|uniref:MBL fold metallo-hydrolase n=1 Tax=Natronosalvus halobius TaxID=2953746 RepID=UPI0020A00FDF|nr:MBL fold metallo-hydrolase [Natronosalvus halobius]USZ73593.1 MBL fold metallo-hydrolase [Natronosalvus halobius]